MDGPSSNYLQSVNGYSLNGTVLFIFLTVTRQASQRRIIVAAITALFLVNTFEFGIQWWTLQNSFVTHGDSRMDAYVASLDLPAWVEVILSVNALLMLVIADGLLLWRCYHVWRGSRRVLALSLILWVAEIGLSIVIGCLAVRFRNGVENPQQADIQNHLQAAVYFISAGQSIMTTLLIAYRIYSISSWETSSIKRFKGILDILIQSSALYTFATISPGVWLAQSVGNVAPSLSEMAADNYLSTLSFSISALAPTIMVARVALLAPDTTYPSGSTIPPLSVLQFRENFTVPDKDRGEIESAVREGHESGNSAETESKTL